MKAHIKEIIEKVKAMGNSKKIFKCLLGFSLCLLILACPAPESVINVESVALDQSGIKITEGDEVKLNVTVLPENATNKDISWTSSDESIVSVSEDGLIKGIKEGSAVVKAESVSNPDKKAEVRVTVVKNVAASSIKLNKESVTLALSGENSFTLVATVTPEDATNKTIVWTSSDKSVATVSNDGVVNAIALGEATISATIEGTNLSASCNVSVINESVPLTGIYGRDLLDIWFEDEEKLTFTPIPENATNPDLYWYSEDENIVTIDSNGIVKGLKEGKANIIAKSRTYEDISKTVEIIVEYLPLKAISIEESEVSLSIGEEKTLNVTYSPDEVGINRTIRWESSDESIATVDQNGVVKGIKGGSVTITAYGANDTSTSCAVTVIGYSIANDGTWQIYDKNGLKEFFSKNAIGNAILMNDIVLNDDNNWKSWSEDTEGLEMWAPVKDFRGTLDGNDHSIRGLYYVYSGSSDGASGGLFKNVSSGCVKNLIIESGFISVTNSGPYFVTYAGSIAGKIEDGASITNCKSFANVNAAGEQSVYAGGLVGYVGSETVIKDSINYGKVLSKSNRNLSYAYSGGIAGYIDENITGVFNGNENNGDVEAYSQAGTQYAGGITAYLDRAEIESSLNRGTIKTSGGGDSYLGGIAGEAYNEFSSITTSLNAGSILIESTQSVYAGGVVGRIDKGTVENCYNRGEIKNTEQITGQVYLGGVIGTSSSGGANISNIYNTGHITIESSYSNDIYNVNVGGLIGDYSSDEAKTLTSSYNKGEITVTQNGSAPLNLGGIIGEASGLNIEKCYNIGNLNANSSFDANVGGIAGFNALTTNNTYNAAEISAKADGNLMLGGIVGNAGNPLYVYTPYVKNSYNTGTLTNTGTGNSSIGAIIGGFSDGGDKVIISSWFIRNSYFLERSATLGHGYFTSWPTYEGSFETRSEEEMKSEEFVDLLNSGQTQASWKASSSGGYPELIF